MHAHVTATYRIISVHLIPRFDLLSNNVSAVQLDDFVTKATLITGMYNTNTATRQGAGSCLSQIMQ